MKLLKINKYKLFLIFFIILFLINVIFNLVFVNQEVIGPKDIFEDSDSIIFDMITIIVLAPLLETLFFQHIVFKIVKKYIKLRKFNVYILISALLFGLSHYYSISYIFFTIMMGVVFAYYYYISYLRRENSFKLVCLLHFCYNGLLLSVNFLIS